MTSLLEFKSRPQLDWGSLKLCPQRSPELVEWIVGISTMFVLNAKGGAC